MSKAAGILGVGLLILGGILAASSTQGELLQFEQTNYIQDGFPFKTDWGANGTIGDSLSDVDGDLIISQDELDNTTDPKGVYNSNIFQKGDSWSFTKITATASQLTKTGANQARINLTVYGVGEDDAILKSKTFDLEENKVSYDTSNLSEEDVTGYKFEAVLYGEGELDTSPRLENVTISGNSVSTTTGSDYPVNLTTLLLVILGFGAFILLK